MRWTSNLNKVKNSKVVAFEFYDLSSCKKCKKNYDDKAKFFSYLATVNNFYFCNLPLLGDDNTFMLVLETNSNKNETIL